MAAKKRPNKSKGTISKLRYVSSKKSLNGHGALEPVVGAYFTTVFRVVNDRRVWGNFTSTYALEDYPTLDPNDILSKASEIRVRPGDNKKVVVDTFLVAKGRNHSLLIMINNWFDGALILDFHKPISLTMGSLYSKVKYIVDKNSLESRIYVTQKQPKSIDAYDLREWLLVTSSGGKRGWELIEDAGSPATYLDASEPELLLHAYINSPGITWALGADDSEILSEIERKQKYGKFDLANVRKKK